MLLILQSVTSYSILLRNKNIVFYFCVRFHPKIQKPRNVVCEEGNCALSMLRVKHAEIVTVKKRLIFFTVKTQTYRNSDCIHFNIFHR